MKKFALLTIGFSQPTPEIMESWNKWFKSIGDRIESQVGLRNGKELTKNGFRNFLWIKMQLQVT